MKVQIFSDIACPWCYIGRARFRTALDQFEHRDAVEVEFKSYQLDPSLPDYDPRTEVEYLSQTKGMPVDRVTQMFSHVAEQGRTEGLDFHFDSVVVANSWKAHRLLQRAKAVSTDTLDAVEQALFRAHFTEGRNIGDDAALRTIGISAGLSEEQVNEALTDPVWENAARNDIAQARALGVQGVPFFVVDQKYGISGAQSADVFLQALAQAWNERSGLTMVSDSELDGQACGPEGC